MKTWTKSTEILKKNARWIPGGVVSLNRKTEPNICFTKGRGSRVRDADGNEYIDYQAGFSAIFLGHNDADINEAVGRVLDDEALLMGAGPTSHEGRLAELFCQCVPTVDSIQVTNTGSEATYHAIRIARAVTGNDHVVIMQGGYNGWHNDVAGNVISAAENVGGRVSPGEYPFDAISAGIPERHKSLVHVVNFNDLESVRYVLQRYPVGCIILEPVLQNIGVVKPQPGYLQGLRDIADEQGCLLIFDEVKTGFRHALGGYQSIAGVTPDLSTFGKAIANGFPIGIIGGKQQYMDYFTHSDPRKKVLIAGTYNAHPVPTAAAIASLQKLASPQHNVYAHVEKLGAMMEQGLNDVFTRYDTPVHVARQGSAFCVYFMDHQPRDFHDLLEHNRFEMDRDYRRRLIEEGIYHFPLPLKQGSISFAHSEDDISETLETTKRVVNTLFERS
jgi:glutamate-1-semialdehyde 2,1-aminomutase